MSASILLLLGFQIFWLQSAHREKQKVLERTCTHLLFDAIWEMQDSLTTHNIVEPLTQLLPDSLLRESDRKTINRIAVAQRYRHSYFNVDTITLVRDTNQQLNLLFNKISAQPPKPITNNRPLNIQLPDLVKGKPVVIRLHKDTLSKDLLEQRFKQKLRAEDITLKVTVFSAADSLQFKDRGILIPENRRRPSFVPYRAALEDYQLFLFKKIIPEFLFSLLLLLLTISAFVLMFRSLKKQQRLTRTKNELISNISHELKTPISTATVALEALRSFRGLENRERTEEYLSISQQELKRLNLLVDKVLKTAIFEENATNLHLEMVDLNELSRMVADNFQLQADRAGAVINTSLSERPLLVKGDRTHLTSVLYNLLENALKYGGRYIDLSLTGKKKQALIEVRDDGPGIAQKYHRKIFEKFFRVPNGDRHNQKGHGLGLTYVASVLKAHEGSIHLISEPGKGANFQVLLPLSKEMLHDTH